MAKRDSSLVGVRDVIAGCLTTWYVCHVTPRGRYYFQSFWVECKNKVLVEFGNERARKIFRYIFQKKYSLQYGVPIFFKIDNILFYNIHSFIFYCSDFEDLYIRHVACFLLFCSRTLLDTAYNVAGIQTFVVRAQSVVSQNALYFFFGSSMRGVCGFICNTNSIDRSGFLQNSGMPFTWKVSRFLAYSEYLLYRICLKKKKKKKKINHVN